MGNVKTFRDLIAYQKARVLVRLVRGFTSTLPREERFELTGQIHRAASSVPLNIAEGFGMGTNAGMLRHLRIARGSLFETDAALDLVGDAELGEAPAEIRAHLAETDRVLQGLIRSLERKAEHTNA